MIILSQTMGTVNETHRSSINQNQKSNSSYAILRLIASLPKTILEKNIHQQVLIYMIVSLFHIVCREYHKHRIWIYYLVCSLILDLAKRTLPSKCNTSIELILIWELDTINKSNKIISFLQPKGPRFCLN